MTIRKLIEFLEEYPKNQRNNEVFVNIIYNKDLTVSQIGIGGSKSGTIIYENIKKQNMENQTTHEQTVNFPIGTNFESSGTITSAPSLQGGSIGRTQTFGEKLVGLTFNPSNDDAVGNVKQKFADAADILNNVYQQN